MFTVLYRLMALLFMFFYSYENRFDFSCIELTLVNVAVCVLLPLSLSSIVISPLLLQCSPMVMVKDVKR